MAEERINPFIREDRYSLDHLTRYACARPLVGGKRVLDIACGTGFGSALLAQSGVQAIDGVDVSAEAIRQCRADWPLHGLSFHEASIGDFAASTKNRYDVIVCFETLEHIADPWPALEALRSLLTPGGILLASVPGETEEADDNPYHLHRFRLEELEKGLKERFGGVRLFRQRFFVESTVDALDAPLPALLQERRGGNALEMDFERAPADVDTYLFLAAAELANLPDLMALRVASRQVWLAGQAETTRAYEGAKRFAAENDRLRALLQKLYVEHSDLSIKFTNMLGWGTYHYEQVHGKLPEQSYMEKIAKAQSTREKKLEQRVRELTDRVGELEATNGTLLRCLADLKDAQRDKESAKRDVFLRVIQENRNPGD